MWWVLSVLCVLGGTCTFGLYTYIVFLEGYGGAADGRPVPWRHIYVHACVAALVFPLTLPLGIVLCTQQRFPLRLLYWKPQKLRDQELENSLIRLDHKIARLDQQWREIRERQR